MVLIIVAPVLPEFFQTLAALRKGSSTLAAEEKEKKLLEEVPWLYEFPVGTDVEITKEGKQMGQFARVTDTNWNGMIKVEVTTGDFQGSTKSYQASQLRRASGSGRYFDKNFKKNRVRAQTAF